MTTKINIFPALLPEESVAGYVMRTIALNGGSQFDGLKQLRGTGKVSRMYPAAFPGNLSHLVAQAPNVFISIDHLIRWHTVEPLFHGMLPASDVTRLRSWLCSAGADKPAFSLLRNVLGRRYGRHCKSCASEDEQRFGVAYWRRIAQLSFVAICPIHEESYVAGCGVCLQQDLSTARWALPSRRCACGRPHKALVASNAKGQWAALLQLSKFADALLRLELPASISGAAAHAYRAKAIERGFVHQGKLSVFEVQRAILSGESSAALRGIDAAPIKAIESFKRIFNGETPSKYVVLQLLLIDLLFGSVEHWISACIGARADRDDGPAVHSQAAPEEIVVWRARLERLLKTFPGATRDKLNRKDHKLMCQLRKHDYHWLNGKVPKQCGARKRAETMPVQNSRSERDDDALAREISQRAIELRDRPGRPKRLVKSSLLAGSRRARMVLSRGRVGPLTAQALEALVESEEQYRTRCVSWGVRHPESFPTLSAQTQYIAGYAKCSFAQATVLIENYRASVKAHL